HRINVVSDSNIIDLINLVPSSSYTIKLVTERGRIFSTNHPPDVSSLSGEGQILGIWMNASPSPVADGGIASSACADAAACQAKKALITVEVHILNFANATVTDITLLNAANPPQDINNPPYPGLTTIRTSTGIATPIDGPDANLNPECELASGSLAALEKNSEIVLVCYFRSNTGANGGGTVTFLGTARGTLQGLTAESNYVFSNEIQIGNSQDLESATDVAGKLLTRADLLLGLPGMARSNRCSDECKFAVTVANPTDLAMEVYEVSIQFVPSVPNNNMLNSLDQGPGNSYPWSNWISPAGGSTSNVIIWRDFANPTTIAPRGAVSFVATAYGSAPDLQTATVSARVFTSFGSFAKVAYTMLIGGSSVDDALSALLYYSDSSSSPQDYYYGFAESGTGTPNDNVTDVGYGVGIPSGSSKTFHVVAENSCSSCAVSINPGAQLTINIPQGWIVTAPTDGFDGGVGWGTVNLTQLADGSTRIRVAIDSSILPGAKRALNFTATSPTPTTTALYGFYTFFVGSGSGSDQPISPVVEMVVQVKTP
ncbi:MAG: hypothetical protein ACE5KO_05305, partial [Candidatus Bathyarchaeia archaeon]